MRLFVYGSLRRNTCGQPHPLLVDAVHEGPATIRGRLYRVTWYPGVVPAVDGEPVIGELYDLPAASETETLARLDAYEGAGFARRCVHVTRADGAVVDAWIYEWLGTAEAAERIPEGDWRAVSGPVTHHVPGPP